MSTPLPPLSSFTALSLHLISSVCFDSVPSFWSAVICISLLDFAVNFPLLVMSTVSPPVIFTGFEADISMPVAGVSSFTLFSWHVIVTESAAVTDRLPPALMLKLPALDIETAPPLLTVMLPPLVTCTALSVIMSTPLVSLIFTYVTPSFAVIRISSLSSFISLPSGVRRYFTPGSDVLSVSSCLADWTAYALFSSSDGNIICTVSPFSGITYQPVCCSAEYPVA